LSRPGLFVLAVALAIGAAAPPAASAQPVSRKAVKLQREIDAVVQQAAAQNKAALVYFTSSSCPPCRMLEKQFFPDPEVSRALTDRYVMLTLNGEKAMDAGIYRKYGIKAGFPAFLALDASGNALGSFNGAAVKPPGQGTGIDRKVMLAVVLGLAKPKA
jgi:thioredoxin-related protein